MQAAVSKIIPFVIFGVTMIAPAHADTFWQDQPRGQPGSAPAPENAYSRNDESEWNGHTGYGHVWINDRKEYTTRSLQYLRPPALDEIYYRHSSKEYEKKSNK